MQQQVVVIHVNGEQREVPANRSITGLLEVLNVPAERVAVELDKTIVRKRDWPNVTVADGARLEIVEFVGGG